jgi:hypothetical protein
MAKSKISVRHVKFTPEEMAYDGPSPEELRTWKSVGRGKAAIFAKSEVERTVTLDPDVAEVFANSKIVNNALRGLIEIAKHSVGKRRRTA